VTSAPAEYAPDCSGQRVDALRDRIGETDVTALEVFFDLVFVFAVGQVSQLLASNLSWRGALESATVMLAVWWAWIDTAWITNWFDPRKMPVRLMLITLMAVSLVMAAAIPQAFAGRADWFALGYVAIQAGRSLFCLFLLGDNPLRSTFIRISFWALLSAPLWIAGALAEGDARLALWLSAAMLDSVAPAFGFHTPRLGRGSSREWAIAGGHLAERCQLFVVIALGESILRTGSSLSQNTHVEPITLLTFLAAFTLNVLMWWVYFARAGRATDIFVRSPDPGAMGRAFTYFHLPMITGIVVLAVANDLAILDPRGDASAAFVATLTGGALLYLAGNAVFNSTITSAFPWRRLSAAAAVLLSLPLARHLTPFALMVWVIVPFAVLALVDTLTLKPRDEGFELD
jgi:low temperature requirement protein LtrA